MNVYAHANVLYLNVNVDNVVIRVHVRVHTSTLYIVPLIYFTCN